MVLFAFDVKVCQKDQKVPLTKNGAKNGSCKRSLELMYCDAINVVTGSNYVVDIYRICKGTFTPSESGKENFLSCLSFIL